MNSCEHGAFGWFFQEGFVGRTCDVLFSTKLVRFERKDKNSITLGQLWIENQMTGQKVMAAK